MKLNNKGFTLVELIAAVAIITLLTVVVAPSVISSLNTGKEKSYEILVENIVTASQELYEEVYTNKLMLGNAAPKLYKYDATEYKPTTKIEIVQEDDSISSISVNLQTLVSNGFLSGSNKKISDSDSTRKVIINPKSDERDEIGGCEIKITRNSTTAGKVTYTIVSTNQIKDSNNKELCPKTEDYKKGVN